MKPEKIYVRVGTLSSNGSAEEYVLPEWYEMPHIGSIEYIRKDALLEKINSIRAVPHENSIARDLAFQEIVGIINSI